MKQFLRMHPNSVAALLFALLSVALALYAGKDLNWDLFNYHYYNGWAFLHQRAALDLAPAQLQTYFNPLLDVPLYLAIRYLPPWLVAVLYACVQSLNCWLVWLLARRLLPQIPRRGWVALGLALMTLSGAIYHSEIGGGMGDILFSIPLLIAIWLLVAHAETIAAKPWRKAALWLVLAGFCAGMAGGLKLVALIYALGFGLATCTLAQRAWQRATFPMFFGLGAMLGWLALGGPWMLHLWQDFANPFYPLFNNFFDSPLAPTVPLQDGRFLPQAWWQALIYPLYWLANPRAVSDVGHFRDLRLPLLYGAGVVWLLWRLRKRAAVPLSRAAAFLLLGIALSYVMWLSLFGIYRYLSVIELLAPLALILLFSAIGMDRRAMAILLLLAAVCVLPLRWGRGDWTEDYFDVRLPASVMNTRNGMILMGSTIPSSFLLPLLPEGLRYVRLASNFHGQAIDHGLDRRAHDWVADYRGPLFVLFNAAETGAMDASLGRYALQRETSSCVSIETAGTSTRPVALITAPFLWCEARRL